MYQLFPTKILIILFRHEESEGWFQRFTPTNLRGNVDQPNKDDFATLCESIASYSSNLTYLEDKLLKHITQMDYHKLQCISASVFHASFKRGLNRFLLELLRNENIKEKRKEWASIFRKKREKTPLLMEDFKSNEDVVIHVLEAFKDDISGTIDCVLQETGENILHIFLKKGMQRAVFILIEIYDVSKLAFAPNANGDIPLTLAINNVSYNEKESATAIW